MNEMPQRGRATGQLANFGWDRVRLGRAEQQADPRSIDSSKMGPALGIVNGAATLPRNIILVRRRFAERLEWCEPMGRDTWALRVTAKPRPPTFPSRVCVVCLATGSSDLRWRGERS